jgi:hypothetical protein
MPKHPGQKIARRDADHEENGQTEIHAIIMDRLASASLSQIKRGQYGKFIFTQAVSAKRDFCPGYE